MQQAESIEQKVIELLDRVEAGAIDAAPEAAEITLRAVYWDGLMTVATGVVMLLLALSTYWFLVKPSISWLRRERESKPVAEPDSVFAVMGSVGLLLILIGLALDSLLTRHAWIAIFDTEAAFALKIIGGGW